MPATHCTRRDPHPGLSICTTRWTQRMYPLRRLQGRQQEMTTNGIRLEWAQQTELMGRQLSLGLKAVGTSQHAGVTELKLGRSSCPANPSSRPSPNPIPSPSPSPIPSPSPSPSPSPTRNQLDPRPRFRRPERRLHARLRAPQHAARPHHDERRQLVRVGVRGRVENENPCPNPNPNPKTSP